MSEILVLKETFVKRIKEDDLLKLKLAQAYPTDIVKVSTVIMWLKNNHSDLTTATRLEIIKKHFEVLETAELLERKTIEEVAS